MQLIFDNKFRFYTSKWMKFVFIVTCSIFLQSYWISDDVILIFSNLVYYLQSVLSSRLKLVNFNAIQWLSVSLGVIVHVQVTSLTYEAKSERNWRFLGSLPCVIQRIYHIPQKWSFEDKGHLLILLDKK